MTRGLQKARSSLDNFEVKKLRIDLILKSIESGLGQLQRTISLKERLVFSKHPIVRTTLLVCRFELHNLCLPHTIVFIRRFFCAFFSV